MPTSYQTAVIWLSQHLAELKGEMNRAALSILRRISVHMYLSGRQKVRARLLSYLFIYFLVLSPPLPPPLFLNEDSETVGATIEILMPTSQTLDPVPGQNSHTPSTLFYTLTIMV